MKRKYIYCIYWKYPRISGPAHGNLGCLRVRLYLGRPPGAGPEAWELQAPEAHSTSVTALWLSSSGTHFLPPLLSRGTAMHVTLPLHSHTGTGDWGLTVDQDLQMAEMGCSLRWNRGPSPGRRAPNNKRPNKKERITPRWFRRPLGNVTWSLPPRSSRYNGDFIDTWFREVHWGRYLGTKWKKLNIEHVKNFFLVSVLNEGLG